MGTNSYHGAAVRTERVQHDHFDVRNNDNGKTRADNASSVGSASSWYHEAAVKEVQTNSRRHAS
jgi:hypothetical protein